MGHAKLVNSDHSGSWPSWLAKAGAVGQDTTSWQPVVVVMGTLAAEKQLKELTAGGAVKQINDNYDEQLAELFLSQNAQLYRANPDVKASSIADMLKDHYKGKPPWQMGSWVFYPWSGQLVHILSEDLFWNLRTIRNRNLITDEEQQKYADFTAACLGMSVGSSGAVCLVLQGGSRHIKIADGAVISGSNLNRIKTGVASVGLEKSLVVARQLYEMNPYIIVQREAGSINAKSLGDFLDQPVPARVVVDEIDDLEMKIRLRVAARERKLPVIMATDLNDNVMLDVERFDLDPNLPLFHGLVGHIEDVLAQPNLNPRQWLKYATAIIGTKNVPLRMQQSLLQVGSKLPTQPQMGGASNMAGSVVEYAVRKLALGQPLKSGRVSVSLDSDLLHGHNSFGNRRAHRRHSKVLDRALDAM